MICSFDVIRDGLGGPRSAFPHDVLIAAGTQAADARSNYVALMRLSNLGQVSSSLYDFYHHHRRSFKGLA
jgi:hypothetical protein